MNKQLGGHQVAARFAITEPVPLGRSKGCHFACNSCGQRGAKWAGRCPSCLAWNSLEERAGPAVSSGSTARARAPTGGAAVSIFDVEEADVAPLPTGISEFDRVLGGGFVPGSITLLGGEPGIGKSTLLLQAVAGFVSRGGTALYVAAEEAARQVRLRAERVGALQRRLWLVSESELESVIEEIDRVVPALLVIDSVQVLHSSDHSSAPGSVTQVREVAHRLASEARARGMAVVLVGHVTKDGSLAGPRQLEHLVDTVLAFEGDRHHSLRQLRAVKHRFGSTSELGLFEMTEGGLLGVPDASSLFLADRAVGEAGSIVHPLMDGRRPMLVEVQALVASSPIPSPRRTAEGVDSGRVAMLLAVLERRLGLSVLKSDVHVLAAGGIRVHEPAADLSIALAVASALHCIAMPAGLLACGEVGLAGEVRNVPHVERRLREGLRSGFTTALVPASAADLAGSTDLKIVAVRSVAEALQHVRIPVGLHARSAAKARGVGQSQVRRLLA